LGQVHVNISATINSAVLVDDLSRLINRSIVEVVKSTIRPGLRVRPVGSVLLVLGSVEVCRVDIKSINLPSSIDEVTFIVFPVLASGSAVCPALDVPGFVRVNHLSVGDNLRWGLF